MICDVMKSMMLTAHGDVTFPGRYWSLFIHVKLTDWNANCMYCHHIPMQAFSFDPLNNTVFRNSWPVFIFKNYLVQTEGFWKKNVCNMNCVFSVQHLSETLLIPVQGVVQWGLMGRHDVTNSNFVILRTHLKSRVSPSAQPDNAWKYNLHSSINLQGNAHN